MMVFEKLIKKIRAGRARELRNMFNMFLRNHATGGIFLMITALAAIIFANIPSLSHLHNIWDQYMSISLGSTEIKMSLLHWINDGLMAVFFFVVGLEIKREILVGELSSLKQAVLPIVAAFGGMIVPASIFYFINHGAPTQQGWGIPMATDIAFALGIIALLGKRVPLSLKIFLTALAIVDDLGAIIVLAVFYPTHAIDFQMLLIVFGILLLLFALNKLNFQNGFLYIIIGIILWLVIMKSGLHATLAGVLLALFIPHKTKINEVRFYSRSKFLLEKFKSSSKGNTLIIANKTQQEVIDNLHSKLQKINPLMNQMEHSFDAWVTFFIIPLFALANSGVVIDIKTLFNTQDSLTVGIFFGLVFGKPLGIFLASFLAYKLKFAELPKGVSWSQIFSVGVIAGIGFTMSIFIDNLAFTDQATIEQGKAAILTSSFIAAVIGFILLHITTRKKKAKKYL